MKVIDQFTYEESGVTITFKVVPLQGNQTTKKYAFAVDGDEALTEKLLLSVKNKEVTLGSIPYCAKALFEIIKNNIFSVLISDEEYRLLYEKFLKEFNGMPAFDVKDISVKNNPRFSAKILNNGVPPTNTGEGRTKQEAKGRALETLFETASA